VFSVGNLQLFVRKLQLCALPTFLLTMQWGGGGPGKAPAANA